MVITLQPFVRFTSFNFWLVGLRALYQWGHLPTTGSAMAPLAGPLDPRLSDSSGSKAEPRHVMQVRQQVLPNINKVKQKSRDPRPVNQSDTKLSAAAFYSRFLC